MANPPLTTYVNDHLAGSTMALELLAHLEEAPAHRSVSAMLAALRADVAADRQELEALMKRLDIPASPPRRAAAWLMEKVTEIKLRLDDERGGAFRLLQGLEIVAIGIEGKRTLWQTLASVAVRDHALHGVDYGRLIARADDQRAQLEVVRLQAAWDALIPDSAHPEASPPT